YVGHQNVLHERLVVLYDLQGQRHVDYKTVVTSMEEGAFPDWPVRGPRTELWTLKFMEAHGGTPTGRHSRWLSETRFAGHEPGVDEHERVCRILERKVVHDPLNVANLASGEMLARAAQLQEERYRDRLAPAVDSPNENAHVMLGTDQLRGHVCVAPALQEFCRDELSRPNAYRKVHRKAREERELSRKSGKDKNKGNGGKGSGENDKRDWANDASDVMNAVCAPGAQPSAVGLAECQRASLEHIQSAFASLETLPAVEGFEDGAPSELLDGSPRYSSGGPRWPHSRDLISWPDVGEDPVPITDVVADPGAQWLRAWSSSMLRDRGEADALLQQVCPRGPCVDPHLSFSPVTYGDFLAEMFKRKMVCFQVEDPSIKPVGVFCLAKKSGRLRLIFDTRTANAYFADPPATALPSAAAFANLEAPGGRVVVAAGDVDNAFYRLKLPDGLCDYFRLPPIARRHLEARGVAGLPPTERVQACLVVLPMGFSWALHMCQLALRAGIERAGVPRQLVIEDGLPGVVIRPEGQAAVAGYVDNYVAVSSVEAEAGRALASVTAELEGVGLRVHTPEQAADSCSFLGMELRRGRWLTINGRTAWRLRYAIEELLRRGRASGHLVRILVGHLTWAPMVGREALGLLNSTYAFIASTGAEVQTLWPAVRAELWRARCLLPLLVADLTAPWASRLVASDASEEGLGVCRRQAPVDLVARCGRQCERWRYRVAGGARARDRALLLPTSTAQPPGLPSESSPDATTTASPCMPDMSQDTYQDAARGSPEVFEGACEDFKGFQVAKGGLGIEGSSKKQMGFDEAATDARARRAALAARLMVERPASGQLSALETLAVRPGTEEQCRRILQEFVAFCSANHLDWKSLGQLDEATTRFLNYQFAQGAPASQGSLLLASLAHFLPGLQGSWKAHLLRATRSSVAWQRRAPAMTRAPLPWCAAVALAGLLAISGRRRMAIWILLAFSCYLRPFEAQGLRGVSLVRPAAEAAASAGSWALLLHPASEGRPGKTGLFNESVVIDLDLHLWPLLGALKGVVGPEQSLWDFTLPALRDQFKKLDALGPTLRALRHGGASWDLLETRRTLEQVQRRGRWAAAASMKRYAEEAYLQEVMTRVPDWVFTFGRVVHASLQQIVELGPGVRHHPRAWQLLPALVQALIAAGLP
ncbi:unnamed protein product, partial [Prorocentrum cordatum]